jgi:hypothetical protein
MKGPRHGKAKKRLTISIGRLAGHGTPILLLPVPNGIETWQEVSRRHDEMLRYLRKFEHDPIQLRALSRCGSNFCGMYECSEGCWYGTAKRRSQQISTAYQLLRDHPGPWFDVCIVHPLWEAPVGALKFVKIASAVQWLFRRLRNLSGKVIGIGTFEVSLNVELDGETYWAGELHFVVAGAYASQIRRALHIEDRHRAKRPHARLLVVTEVENLARRIAYATKRFVQERRAYISQANGRQHRRSVPLRSAAQTEHDTWLLSLKLGARTVCFGARRRGLKFFPRE